MRILERTPWAKLGGQYRFGSADQGGEEPVEIFDGHRLAAFALAEITRSIHIGIGWRLGSGKGWHVEGVLWSDGNQKPVSPYSNG